MMKIPNEPPPDKDSYSISARFRNTNIALFLLISAISVSVMAMVLQNITDNVSKDYARFYSTNTAAALSTHLNREIALVRKAARSDAVVNWFADEYNYGKKAAAHAEMLEIIDILYSDNMYLGIHKHLNEFTIEKNFTVDDIKPHATLDPHYSDDAWYFDCVGSPNDYVLNVDIDKVLQRKRVWLNYKVTQDGVPLGVICTGLEFGQTAEALLGKYDNTKVRGLIIDKNGVIQMDSKNLGQSNFLHYGQFSRIEDEFPNPLFLQALKEHLTSIDGFFKSYSPVVINLSNNKYSYATIAPIEATNWSVITFYNAASLFNTTQLVLLIIVTAAIFTIFAVISSTVGYRFLFKPVELLGESLARLGEGKSEQIYGVDRQDEIGELSRTIQNMKERLDSYNTNLEIEVEKRSEALTRAYEKTRDQHQIILASINYASRIQRHLLPSENEFKKAFSDYSIIWNPRDVVGGDIYWIKNFASGAVLCVCDCTGHGTPGAMMTMLVTAVFESAINETNCQDTAQIIWELEKRLTSTLNVESYEPNSRTVQRGLHIRDGCDIAVLYIGKDGAVKISAANMRIYLCDGQEVTQIRGQKIRIGDGTLANKEKIEIISVPPNPNNKFYIASDGLYEQIGGKDKLPFGYGALKKIILENHNETQNDISEKIWQVFENYRGSNERRDDFELISFKP